MKNLKLHCLRMDRTLISSMTLLAVIITAALVHGHGGKHSDKFTQLQALQKATILYDQLIDKGKLDQSWETGLMLIKPYDNRNSYGATYDEHREALEFNKIA